MIEEVEGIILSVTPYGETSKIINVYTKEHGIIGIICKGAMSVKSRLRSFTQKLTYGNFNIYYKTPLKDYPSMEFYIITNNIYNYSMTLTLMFLNHTSSP